MGKVTKTIAINTVIGLILSLGILGLLNLGLRRGVLSSREVAVGMVLWTIGICAIEVFLGRRLAENYRISQGKLEATLYDVTQKPQLRRIRIRKVWIGILAALLPIGIANGILYRAWLPTLVGAVMNLLMIYVAREDIRRLQKSLH